ncbi:MAG TPA: CCA tRNA nucleotidyltransferase [Phycisphaerae bacterium]|nr:CCA tRNA nucleotidyltransferase [Phycisphaerae bacterium]
MSAGAPPPPDSASAGGPPRTGGASPNAVELPNADAGQSPHANAVESPLANAVESPLAGALPPGAEPALRVARLLRGAGHAALLAGGCVRDLLLGVEPTDYDVATDATPDRVRALLRPTRMVGAQFGVVLARSLGRWVEVATFRSDGRYLDGRHPSSVTFGDARADAARRDFTINGMFCDPQRGVVIDYVGGQADLRSRLVRAIGDPRARFSEDHLRLLRAVRFTSRLDFALDPPTAAAMTEQASLLARVAAERVRDELERMLAHTSRRRAFALMAEHGLLPHLRPGTSWSAPQIRDAEALLAALPADAPAEVGLRALLLGREPPEIERICRDLTCSNEQRETVLWLAAHEADLDEPDALPLAALKRLMAHAAFPLLRQLASARARLAHVHDARMGRLDARLAAIRADAVAPPPLVSGVDLQERGVAPGPVYKRVLAALYTAQLDERLSSREEALALLDRLLAAEAGGPQDGP